MLSRTHRTVIVILVYLYSACICMYVCMYVWSNYSKIYLYNKWVVNTTTTSLVQLIKGRTIIFLSGGYHFWDLQTIFVWKVMRFKQFFSLHFVMKTIFLWLFLKKCYNFFSRSYLKKKTLLVHAYTRKVSSEWNKLTLNKLYILVLNND